MMASGKDMSGKVRFSFRGRREEDKKKKKKKDKSKKDPGNEALALRVESCQA